VDTQSNIELLKKILEKNQDKHRITIVLDNAPMNKSHELFDFIKENNKCGPVIELMYTPPYSPHLNLIERLWRFLKKKLLSNQYYSSYIRFKQVIEDFLFRKIKRYKKELRSLMTENFDGIQSP